MRCLCGSNHLCLQCLRKLRHNGYSIYDRVSAFVVFLFYSRFTDMADVQAFWDRLSVLRVISVGDVVGSQKVERRERRQTIADAIVAVIGRSWLRL